MIRIETTRLADFIRFFIASFGGVLFDFALSLTLFHALGFPLLFASVVSLICASILMYFVHEFWTFGNGAYSWRRLIAALLAAGSALACRSIVIVALHSVLGEAFSILQLLAAVSASFFVNYFLVRRVMLASKTEVK